MATGGVASAALVACNGEAVEEDLTPTRVSGVEGAPPTLAPNATPFVSGAAEGGGEGEEEQAAGGDGGGTEPITLEAIDPYDWSMYEFEVAPGQQIHIVNTGSLPHNFHADEAEGWDIATDDLNGGEEATVTTPEDAEIGAEVVYYCSVPGHREAGMEGTMTIVEAGAAAGGGGEDATQEGEATPEEGGEEQAAGGGQGGGQTHVVEMTDELVFDPEELTLNVGDTVVWRTIGAVPHTSTCDEGEATQPEEHVQRPEGAEAWNSELVNQGEEFERTFEVAGEYTYFCIPHEAAGMVGYLTVEEGGG